MGVFGPVRARLGIPGPGRPKRALTRRYQLTAPAPLLTIDNNSKDQGEGDGANMQACVIGC
jgi:hypothetical protein